MTLDDAVQTVISTNPLFAVGPVDIRGVSYRAFQNIPAHTRALLQANRENQDDGAAEYLVFGDERWTYDEFCRGINRMAHVLEKELGVAKGQPVALAMRNCPELLILFMAITAIGGVAVFLNAWWTTEELDYALRDSGAKVVFGDAERVHRLSPLVEPLDLTVIGVRDADAMTTPGYSDLFDAMDDDSWPTVDIAPDDDFAIMYSSGTTGHPKGVVQTHRGAMNAVYTWLMQGELAPLVTPPEQDAPEPPRPVFMVVTPLFHVTASHPVFLLSIASGAKLCVMDKWDAEDAVRIIETEKVTRFLGVPTQSADLLVAADRLNASLSTIDFLGSGGAKRPPAQVADLARKFPNANIATGWGMTETNANGIGLAGPDYVDRPGVAGRLYPPIQELRFLDDDGQDVPPGSVGEITVKSPCNMRCYLNKSDATAEVLRDGWLRTGDLGMIDDDGIVTIVDRKKNIIIRGGENIACLDVEGALHRHPAVAEACAFSVPDARLGEVVGAGVQIKSGQDLTQVELTSFLADHIAKFKIPQYVWFQRGPLPRGATDKLDRRALRAICLETLDDRKEMT
ncbi:class I adenylate-forming enzyme family protein [Arenibacterium sp. CAU 1754]